METQIDLQWLVEGNYAVDAFKQLAAEVGQHGPLLDYQGATYDVLNLLLDAQCFDALEVILRENPTLDLVDVRRKAEDKQLFRVFVEQHLAPCDTPENYSRVATLFPLQWLVGPIDNLTPFIRPEAFVAPDVPGGAPWLFPAPELAADIAINLEAARSRTDHRDNTPFLTELEWVALHVLAPEPDVDLPATTVRNAEAYLAHCSQGDHADLHAELVPDRLHVRAIKALDDGTEVALVYRERGGWDLVSADAVLRTPVGEWVWSSPAPVPGTTIPWAARTWF